jgi:hypothetical protein
MNQLSAANEGGTQGRISRKRGREYSSDFQSSEARDALR